MYSDATVDDRIARLRSAQCEERSLAADEVSDGVSPWGHHSYTEPQAARVTCALVEALAMETVSGAREAMVNALAELVAADLAPAREVARALELPRPQDDPAADYWPEIAEWAARHRHRP